MTSFYDNNIWHHLSLPAAPRQLIAQIALLYEKLLQMIHVTAVFHLEARHHLFGGVWSLNCTSNPRTTRQIDVYWLVVFLIRATVRVWSSVTCITHLGGIGRHHAVGSLRVC